MDPVIYILDTNVIADRFHHLPQVLDRLNRAGEAGHVLGLCDPVRYEILRGLLKVNARQKLRHFQETIMPLMDHLALIAPRFPEKILEQNADQQSAYDIHGIHPDDLEGQPSFPDIHGTLWEIMRGKNWVCWNTDFAVMLLDSLCLRHQLPLIPRNRVACAMKLLSSAAFSRLSTVRRRLAFALMVVSLHQHCPGDSFREWSDYQPLLA